MKNKGKVFEEDFKNSIPDYCSLVRLNDSPQAFKQSNLTRFTPKSPFDFTLFDTHRRINYYLELKSTKSKYMSFEDINSDEIQNKMIHKHQIIGLLAKSEYDFVVAGFLFNFRDEDNGTQRTYFQNIKDFDLMRKKINKFSLNEMDIILNGAIKIQGTKKRSRYSWDIESLLQKTQEVMI